MSSSWKKYGGLNKMEKMNNITVNTLVTDTINVRKSYTNEFDLQGDLNVTGGGQIDGDLSVGGTVIAAGISLGATGLDLNGKLYLTKVLGSNGLPIETQSMFLNGVMTEYVHPTPNYPVLGINKDVPQATLDVEGFFNPSTLNVHSLSGRNRNILARNGADNGISLVANGVTYTSVQYYCNNSKQLNSNIEGSLTSEASPDLELKLTETGIFDISGIILTDTNIASKLSISQRSMDHLYDETAIIYDTNGNALTLVTQPGNSNTSLRLVTPNKTGLSITGGYDGATIDVSNIQQGEETAPAQTILAGTSNIKYPKIMKFNTYSKDDIHAVSINGATRIENTDIRVVASTDTNAHFVLYDKSNPSGTALILGAGVEDENATNGVSPFLRTTNAGVDWTNVPAPVGTQGSFFNVGYVQQGTSNSIIATANEFLYYSNNHYNNQYTLSSPINKNFSGVYITSTSKVFLTSLNAGYNFFTLDFSDITGTRNDLSYNDTPLIDSCDGYDHEAWTIHNGNRFVKYDISGNEPVILLDASINNVVENTFNKIRVHDASNAIVIGPSSIAYTKDAGVTWNASSMYPSLSNNLKDVFILDSESAIVVGESNTAYFTTNGYKSWYVITKDTVNGNGRGEKIFTTSATSDLNTVYMPTNDTMVFVPYTSSAPYDVVHLWSPDIVNREKNSSLDVLGNLDVSGSLVLSNGGGLRSQDDHFDLLKTTSEIDIGGGAIMTNKHTNETNISQNVVVPSCIFQF